MKKKIILSLFLLLHLCWGGGICIALITVRNLLAYGNIVGVPISWYVAYIVGMFLGGMYFFADLRKINHVYDKSTNY